MNYQKHYDLLINRAKNRLLESDQYREKHHIVPRCMGGTDEPDNLIELTAEEHYVAHQLLVKMYPEHKGLAWAAILMTCHTTDNRSKNKTYGWLKEKNARMASDQGKERFKCPKYKEKLIQSVVKSNKRIWSDPVKAKQMREKISKNSKKMFECPEYKEKMTNASKEYWSDPENRKKAGERASGKNNPSYGTHWYHDPKTLHNIKCRPDEAPEGYVKGRKLVPDKPRLNTKCEVCGTDTGRKNAKYCDEHRYYVEKVKTEKLFEEFLESDFKSLTAFAKKHGCTSSNISARFKKHIPNYREIINNEGSNKKHKYILK